MRHGDRRGERNDRVVIFGDRPSCGLAVDVRHGALLPSGVFRRGGGLHRFQRFGRSSLLEEVQHARIAPASYDRINVHIENLNVTLELTEAQARSLLVGDRRALPPAAWSAEEDDLS